MEYEFLDDMLARLLIDERKTYMEAFEAVIKDRAATIRDLGRVENAYQLFCKSHPEARKDQFRKHLWLLRYNDWEKCVRCFNWKDNFDGR